MHCKTLVQLVVAILVCIPVSSRAGQSGDVSAGAGLASDFEEPMALVVSGNRARMSGGTAQEVEGRILATASSLVRRADDVAIARPSGELEGQPRLGESASMAAGSRSYPRVDVAVSAPVFRLQNLPSALAIALMLLPSLK